MIFLMNKIGKKIYVPRVMALEKGIHVNQLACIAKGGVLSIDQRRMIVSETTYRVIENEVSDRALFSFSPIVRKKYRIEFHDNTKPHWQPHIGAGEFDRLEEATAWVNRAVDYTGPEFRVVYERTRYE
jgi:hypothetical protein